MMNRRTFALALAAFLAGCSREENPAAPAAAIPSPAADKPDVQVPPPGLQLYTVRDLMATDVAATLDMVAGVGFQEVEFAGYFDHTPAQMRQLLAASGLNPVSGHVGKAQFAEDAARVIAHAAEMGHRYLVIPAVPDDERTLEDFRRHAADFNRWGEACAQAGIQFTYHNHMFEFEETDGQVHFDVLLAETDPELVKIELDLCWTAGANADAVAYFEAWPGRFPLCHLKDFADGRDADIGTGSVDFERALSHAELAGLRHGFVERDHPENSAESIRANYDAILPLWNRLMAAA